MAEENTIKKILQVSFSKQADHAHKLIVFSLLVLQILHTYLFHGAESFLRS